MPKTPQDHKPGKGAPFVYELHGQTITLPSFASVMTFGRARRLRGMSEGDQVFAIVEEVCDDEQLALLDEMNPDETGEFFTAWQKHSEASLGE